MRRRRGGLVTIAALAVLVALVVPLVPGGGHRGVARARTPPTGLPPLVPAPRLHMRSVGGLSRRGLAEVRRLIAAGRPVYCGGTRGDEVAFTFDDGPGVYTHLALRKLRAAHQRATFFVVGRSILGWPGYLRPESRVAALGDHTFTHPDLAMLSARVVTAQIADTRALVERDTRQPVLLFRPPYGVRDPVVNTIVHRLGLLDVLWSVDSADSLGAGYRGIIRNVERGLRPGAIIEMHENRGQTIRALTTLLPALHRRHLRSVSVLQLLADDPPSAVQLRRGEAGCGPHSAFRRARAGHGE